MGFGSQILLPVLDADDNVNIGVPTNEDLMQIQIANAVKRSLLLDVNAVAGQFFSCPPHHLRAIVFVLSNL